MAENEKYLLEVQHLKQYFPIRTGFGKTTPLKAVDDISFAIKPGETLGLVGESGCGKTTTGRTLLRLYEPTDGRITYDGEVIFDKEKAKKRKYRIPEATLLGIALLGGSIGAWFGMQVFRHKTKHRKFTLGIPLILGAQVFFTILCWYYIR